MNFYNMNDFFSNINLYIKIFKFLKLKNNLIFINFKRGEMLIKIKSIILYEYDMVLFRSYLEKNYANAGFLLDF